MREPQGKTRAQPRCVNGKARNTVRVLEIWGDSGMIRWRLCRNNWIQRLPLISRVCFRRWHCDYHPCCRLAGPGMKVVEEGRECQSSKYGQNRGSSCTTGVLLINEHLDQGPPIPPSRRSLGWPGMKTRDMWAPLCMLPYFGSFPRVPPCRIELLYQSPGHLRRRLREALVPPETVLCETQKRLSGSDWTCSCLRKVRYQRVYRVTHMTGVVESGVSKSIHADHQHSVSSYTQVTQQKDGLKTFHHPCRHASTLAMQGMIPSRRCTLKC